MNGIGFFLAATSFIFLSATIAVLVLLRRSQTRTRLAETTSASFRVQIEDGKTKLISANAQLALSQIAYRELDVSSQQQLGNISAKLAQAVSAFNNLKGKAEVRLRGLLVEVKRLETHNASLSKWQQIVDAEVKAEEILQSAQQEVNRLTLATQAQMDLAQRESAAILLDGRTRAGKAEADANARLEALERQLADRKLTGTEEIELHFREAKVGVEAAKQQAKNILADAERSAKEIAGEAWDAKLNLDNLRRLAKAIENQISGYGNRYIVPIRSILDELGVEMGHTEAGKGLIDARAATRAHIEGNSAAACDYAEGNRNETATRFVLDAFNGKVDSILVKVRAENAGTLEQQIRDAFEIVNHLGEAFRNARILDEYLQTRLNELRWAALAQHAKNQQREEQRLLKEQMRDEAKAQREFDRAIKESAKQETALARERMLIQEAKERAVQEERALQEARLLEELKRVSEAQRTEYEARFRQRLEAEVSQKTADFTQQLEEADARILELEAQRQRTKSMAEQTKAGTVYIISNVGSFGEKVFKVGQTRRPNYEERIDELGDASVPFKFDVHAHITTLNAPKLESHFHAKLVEYQMNKMNWRKEFFKVDLSVIREIAMESGLEVEWTMEAAAEDYRNTSKLEAEMASDPAVKERWIQEQLGIDYDKQLVSATNTDDADD